MPETLVTSRLILRAPSPSDAADIMVSANNPRITDMTARMPYPYRLQDALSFVAMCAAEAPHRRSFGIYLKASRPEFIGACGFGPLPPDPVPHLGYWIGERHWGKGYATEAARAVMRLAFETLGVLELYAGCQPGNRSSRAVLEKLGFRHRGTAMIHAPARRRDEMTDSFLLGAADWRRRP